MVASHPASFIHRDRRARLAQFSLLLLTFTLFIQQATAESFRPSPIPEFTIVSVGLTTIASPLASSPLDPTQYRIPPNQSSSLILPEEPISLTTDCLPSTATWQGSSPVFGGLSTLEPGLATDGPGTRADTTSVEAHQVTPAADPARFEGELQSPAPRINAPWVFQGNGAQGVKTWVSERHVLEINPAWLSFDMFESMEMSMVNARSNHSDPPPPEWRNAFTVGVASDWQFTRSLAIHAGYRFYANPIPDEITEGALPNANQHVVAVGMSFREGRHLFSMVYGLDVMDPASAAGISSARHGTDLAELGHLVAFTYGFSF